MIKQFALCFLVLVSISIEALATGEKDEYAEIGPLIIECSNGNKDACDRADKLDREIRELSQSKLCAQPKSTNDAIICGFAAGYVSTRGSRYLAAKYTTDPF